MPTTRLNSAQISSAKVAAKEKCNFGNSSNGIENPAPSSDVNERAVRQMRETSKSFVTPVLGCEAIPLLFVVQANEEITRSRLHMSFILRQTRPNTPRMSPINAWEESYMKPRTTEFPDS